MAKLILVVGQENLALDLLTHTLQEDGLLIGMAADAVEAQGYLNSFVVDLVLLDLPGVDPNPVLNQLSVHPSPPPVVALVEQNEQVPHHRQVRFSMFKPPDYPRLLSTILRLTGA
jgi:DNA-binding response OmpR family regulator